MQIDRLTSAQERSLIEYRDQWLAIGRSTEPADRVTTGKALTSMYAAIGEKQPYIWWCDGPASGSIIRTILRANLGGSLMDKLWDNINWEFWGQHEASWPAFFDVASTPVDCLFY